MRILPSILLLTAIVFCCRSKKQTTDTRELPIEDLELNDVVHDSLSDDQLKSIEKIHSVFSEVTDSSLEETITNFKRGKHPDREIAVWLEMADAYQNFTSSKQLDSNKKKELFTLILLRSMMTREEVIEKANFQYLSNEQVEEIFRNYDPTPKLLKVEKKWLPNCFQIITTRA